MKGLLTSVLALAVLAAFTGPGTAQPQGGEKRRPTGTEERPPATGAKTVDKASPKLMTGKVIRVDPTAKTFTAMIDGKAVTFAAPKLKSLPTVGATVDLRENTARFVFKSCEECNSVCPGVCFLGPDSCRCYLEHLRTK